MFAAAIGEEDEGNIRGLQLVEGFGCSGKRVGGAEEDAIDTGVSCQRDGVL